MSELQGKSLGRIVTAPPQAGELPDSLRVPFEIPFAQLLAYRLSLANGLDPDNPSPEGVITRVVPQFRMHGEAAPGGHSGNV